MPRTATLTPEERQARKKASDARSRRKHRTRRLAQQREQHAAKVATLSPEEHAARKVRQKAANLRWQAAHPEQFKSSRKATHARWRAKNAEAIAEKNHAEYVAMRAAMTPEEEAVFKARNNARQRRYYASHADEACAKAREHWAKPEIRARELARQKARWDADPDYWHAYGREARGRNIDTHKSATKRWVENNRPRTVLAVNKRRARKRNLPATFTLAEEAFARSYFHYACAACGNEEGFAWTIVMDHWIPIASRDCPGTIATNMIPLCNGSASCNSTKHDKDASAWLLQRFGARKAASILKKIHAYFAIIAQHKESI